MEKMYRRKPLELQTKHLLMIMVLLVGALLPVLGPMEKFKEHMPLPGEGGPEPEMEEGSEYLKQAEGFFTENLGQTGDGDVHFLFSEGSVAFLWSGIQVELKDRDQCQKVLVSFEGANSVVPEGRGLLAHRSSFFQGDDPSTWVSGARSYRELVYRELYPGIDLVYVSVDGKLKYEFRLQSFASPGDIRMRYHGCEDIGIDSGGELVISTLVGELREKRPYSYQGSQDGEIEISSAYMLQGQTVSFWLGDYDRSRPLVIDPVLYSTLLGGSDHDIGQGIAVDSEGCVYVAGDGNSSSFPGIKGSYDQGSGVYVAKLGPGGNELLFCAFIGGNKTDDCLGLAIDGENNVYLTGQTSSPDFPTTNPGFGNVKNDSLDAYVVKLSSNGTELIYSTLVGGGGRDYAWDLALDSENNALVVGTTESEDFPTTPGAFDENYNGGETDAFVFKLDRAGEQLLYASYLGGEGKDGGLDIAVDPQGNAYVGGDTRSVNFPVTPGSFDESHNGLTDIFVTKLNPNGTELIYSSFLGSWGSEIVNGVAVDREGSVYLTGFTSLDRDNLSTNFPTTPGCYDNTHAGGSIPNDVFVAKLGLNGSALVYSTFIGGSAYDEGNDIVVDDEGCAYIAGKTDSLDFPTTRGSHDRKMNLYMGMFSGDGFVSKLSSDGSELLYSGFIGGKHWDYAFCLALDLEDNIYIGGTTYSWDFPTTKGSVNREHGGERDIFIVKLEAVGEEEDTFFAWVDPETLAIGTGFSFVTLFLALTLALGFSEIARYRFLEPLAPHYTRLSEERIELDIAQQNTRGRIYRFIADNPGASLGKIKAMVGTGHGTAIYHLSVLQREGFLKSATQGRKKLFWMKENYPGHPKASLTEHQQKILKLMKEHGELSRTRLMELSGLPKTTLHNNLGTLKKAGLVKEEMRDQEYFCSLNEK